MKRCLFNSVTYTEINVKIISMLFFKLGRDNFVHHKLKLKEKKKTSLFFIKLLGRYILCNILIDSDVM